MRMNRLLFVLPNLAILGLLSIGTAFAQQYSQPYVAQPYGPSAPPPSSGAVYAPVGPASSEMFASLSDQPATHSGFVLDRSMMQAAQDFLIQGGIETRRAAAAITGVTIDNWHFRNPAFYPPQNLEALTNTYRAAGWVHLVNQGRNPAQSAQPQKTTTDLWLHHNGADIDAVTVLTRGPSNMNVVQLTGDLRPIDLMHLGGHMGIPRVDPNTVMVPAP